MASWSQARVLSSRARSIYSVRYEVVFEGLAEMPRRCAMPLSRGAKPQNARFSPNEALLAGPLFDCLRQGRLAWGKGTSWVPSACQIGSRAPSPHASINLSDA